MRLRFTSKAGRQLSDISSHIARESPGSAQRVVRDIRAAARLLTEFPEMGRSGSVPTTREWVVSGRPYVIVYRADVTTGELAVIEIFHCAQHREPH